MEKRHFTPLKNISIKNPLSIIKPKKSAKKSGIKSKNTKIHSAENCIKQACFKQFIKNARTVKIEERRRILTGHFKNGEKIFCKLYIEKGLLALIRRILLGNRAKRSHNRTHKFQSIGQVTSCSLGYFLIKKNFLHWENFHFFKYIKNSQTLEDFFHKGENTDKKSRQHILSSLGHSLATLHLTNHIHGDVKLNNILYDGKKLYFIDLDGFGKKGFLYPPGRDVARLVVGLSESTASKHDIDIFISAYCTSMSIEKHALIKKINPYICSFQRKHFKKYGRKSANIFN